MKREEILSLEPGRELDALVEQHVFKKQVVWLQDEYTDPFPVVPVSKDEIGYIVDYSSSEISAAWDVEEQIKTLRLHVEYIQALRKVVMSTGEYVGLFDYIHATPEQRCKAALLAVLEEGETK
ncbi:BC1872 family protein [Paenibacillus sp. DMB20]|uniref:BC1872 family protein n=1 Tax=Paenibacillus sp. DMB20 TaxID=1642570 RepID=UPI000627DF2D|nr:hypothetical protein [Paenibacillus sp. DMB20]KKO51126.1 hypothetical protein XI25_29510 [Paenibacillus sp. DMB20]